MDHWWTTREGEMILISSMADSHLKNAIKMIERNYSDPFITDRNPDYQALVKEAVNRDIWDRSKW